MALFKAAIAGFAAILTAGCIVGNPSAFDGSAALELKPFVSTLDEMVALAGEPRMIWANRRIALFDRGNTQSLGVWGGGYAEDRPMIILVRFNENGIITQIEQRPYPRESGYGFKCTVWECITGPYWAPFLKAWADAPPKAPDLSETTAKKNSPLLAGSKTSLPSESACMQDLAMLTPQPLDINASDIAALNDEIGSLVLMKITLLGAGKDADRLGKEIRKIKVGFTDFAGAAAMRRNKKVQLTPSGPTAASGWFMVRAYPGTVFAILDPWPSAPSVGMVSANVSNRIAEGERVLRIAPPARAEIIYAGEIVLCTTSPRKRFRDVEYKEIIMEPQPALDEIKARFPEIDSIVIAETDLHQGRVIMQTFDD